VSMQSNETGAPGGDVAPSELSTETTRNRIRALRAAGLTVRQIADVTKVGNVQVMETLNGQLRGQKAPPIAANDNKKVVLSAHNGGCSTTSGMVEVSLARSAGGVA